MIIIIIIVIIIIIIIIIIIAHLGLHEGDVGLLLEGQRHPQVRVRVHLGHLLRQLHRELQELRESRS
jgi:hypothetical protein